MEFNDGSQYRVCADPSAYLAERDLFMFRACSAKNGVPYVDRAFAYHRATMWECRGLVLYQYVYANAGTPEDQARFFLTTLGGLATNEMVMLDIEPDGGVTDPVDFMRRWCAVVEPALDTWAWIYVPGALASKLTRGVTEGRVVQAPRYSGTANRTTIPNWAHDVHQYTNQGYFPGCSETGDVSYTILTTATLLDRCNKGGFSQPTHKEGH